MSRLTEMLASYGRYHRDSRNRLTHYFGVPAIVYALLIPATLCVPILVGVRVPLDRIVVLVAALGYLSLDVRLGAALASALASLGAAAEATSAAGTGRALIVAGIVFVLGWALQFLGHRLEGNRPAFLANLGQVLVAPLFLTAELGFTLGLRSRLKAAIDERLATG